MAKSTQTLKLTRQQATREITVAGQDIRYKYGLSGENPDTLVATKGWDYIEGLKKDTHYAAQLAIRRQNLISKGFEITPADSGGKVTARNRMIADFVAFAIDDMAGAFEKDVEGMLDAVPSGFSLSEINYQEMTRRKFAGKIGLASIRFKPPWYFAFTYDDYGNYEIRQIDPNPDGDPRPRHKYIHLISGFNDENPYGDGVSGKVAFWIWLKKNQAKFWAIFNERFGSPIVEVEVPRNTNSAEEAKAKAIIDDIQTRAGIIKPEGFGVKFLEAIRRGDITYGNFIEVCNKEISKVTLGATLISEEGKRGQGSYALSSNMSDIFEQAYTIFDSIITTAAINEQLIKRLVDLNFQTDVYPRFKWSGISIAGLTGFANAILQLRQAGLTNIPAGWVHEKTGIPIAKDGEPLLEEAAAAQGGARGNPVGVDNRAKKSFASVGIGNAATHSLTEQFAELPADVREEVIEAELLKQRYLNQAAKANDKILRKISAEVKKKT